MRPIDRGPVPSVNGAPKVVSDYKSWRADLINRIGSYCCFCNIPLTDSIQVEHVIAQDLNAALALDWNNMLLACGPCNRSKSNQPCPPDTHYLPQFHNTHLAFQASNVLPHPRLANTDVVYLAYRGAPAKQLKANNTIELCKLNQDTTRMVAQATDLRWKYRLGTLSQSIIVRSFWDQLDPNLQGEFIDSLIVIVEGKGFWSIWFEAFADVPPVRQALVERFPGTARSCFDATYIPIPRNPLDPLDTI